MNSKLAKTIIEAASLLFIYLGMQVLFATLGLAISTQFGFTTGIILEGALIAAAFLSIPIIYLVRLVEFRYGWLEPYDYKSYFSLKTPNYHLARIMIPATLAGMGAVGCLATMLEINNTLEDTFSDMSSSIVGVALISLIGPICEEYLFRGAILGGMLRRGVPTWTAILVSALLFGIVHLNPVQVFSASFMGILFAILYVKSKSIIPSVICHIINNSFGVIGIIIDNADPDKPTDPYADIPGGIVTLIILTLLFATASILCYRWYWNRTDSTEA